MIRIGTAGWTIPRATADSFTGEGTHLQRYATVLTAAEINSSFYRPHRPQVYARWAASVPAGFRFSVKLPKTITHELRLAAADTQLRTFLDEIQGLGDRLGCLLVQLPPSLAYEANVAEPFFASLRKLFAGPVVVETRHESWCVSDAERMLEGNEIGRVAADPPRISCGEEPGASPRVRYYRLHGSPRVYYSPYSDEYLAKLAERLYSAPPGVEETWCIFDNTASGAAAEDALRLRSLIAARAAKFERDTDQHQEKVMAKKKAATKKAPKKAATKKSGPKKGGVKKGTKRKAATRELIAPRGDKRYIRRDEQGRIKESDDVSRSLSQDRRRSSKKAAKPGQGDKGDRKPSADRTK